MNTSKRSLLACTLNVLAALSACCAIAEQPTKPSPEEIQFFESKIRPLLHSRCVECHSDANPESGLSLESHAGLMRGGELGAAVVPGKPKESLLISAVNHDEFLKMPPKDKLATSDLALLSKWVAMGAPWPEVQAIKPSVAPVIENDRNTDDLKPIEFSDEQKNFWAYQPLRRSQAPELQSEAGVRSPIDAFVQEKLGAKGLYPAPPASRHDLIRRATYDLTGLPPTEEQIKQFDNDLSPDAFGKVIDRLLASARYGERWGRHWLDVARFADSNGLDENIAYANAFRYRDYVISSFNQDKPYDRFVQEQIAGDLLGPDPASSDPLDRFIGTGFLAIGAKMLAEDDPVKMQMDIIDEQLSTVCQAFMGMTIGCARCHDHKFDPLPAADYYAMAGIFKSSQTMENHKVVARWFERPIATDAELQRMKEIDSEIDSIQDLVKQLDEACRLRVSKEIRASVAPALLATTQYENFSRRSKNELARGMNQPAAAYPVSAGYALIEAEGFQRGTVVRDLNDYGKDIGVIASERGANVEYDLNVEHKGKYAFELRYAAEDRRPVRLLIDGVEVMPSIATQTTGGWYPDGQAWFVSAVVKLDAGSHVLRLESRRLFPHIDKFALVYQAQDDWPFGKPPLALSRMGTEHGVSYPVLALWQNYLTKVRKESEASEPDNFFGLWLRLSDANEDFEGSWKKTADELATEPPLRTSTPSMLRDLLQANPPTSLMQLAERYQGLVTKILSDEAPESDQAKALREQLLAESSPLAGPEKDIDRFYDAKEQTRADELNSKLEDAKRRRPNPPMAMGVTESKPVDLKIHLRGSHLVLGKLVSRRVPQILSSVEQAPISSSSSGRLELAQWITRPNHPLTSRVIANRIWHWHFGRGIVPSTDNFGLLGLQPTHPELLDWLASELVDNAWSIKHLHRTIMLSQTYQMSGQMQPAATESDPENELLWRFRRRRLTGEETRDSIIEVGVGLDQTMFGSLMETENHTYVNTTGGSGSIDYSVARRSVYLPVIRSGVFDVLQTLDFPDPAMINGERQTSTVAPQALLLMNSDLVHEQSMAIAESLMVTSLDDAQRISAAYRRILKRPPQLSEIASAVQFLRNANRPTLGAVGPVGPIAAHPVDVSVWQALCRVLISSNEFSYIE